MKNDKKRNIFYEKRPFAAQATRVLLGKNRIAVDENLKGGPRALSRAPSSARGRLPAVPQRSFKSNAVFWRMLIKFLRKLLNFAWMIFNFVNFVKTYRIPAQGLHGKLPAMRALLLAIAAARHPTDRPNVPPT